MDGRLKVWTFGPPKKSNPKVPKQTKADVENISNEFVESFLKPQYIKLSPKDNEFNYVVDIYTKWYQNYFYFIAKYCCPGPNAISPFFGHKFARIEYIKKQIQSVRYETHWAMV